MPPTGKTPLPAARVDFPVAVRGASSGFSVLVIGVLLSQLILFLAPNSPALVDETIRGVVLVVLLFLAFAVAGPVVIVSERLGHSSIRETMDTYSHVLPSMQQAASDKLEDLLFNTERRGAA